MMASHGKFYRKLVDKEKDNLEECISRMALEISPPEGLVGMDCQLFDIVQDEKGDEIITALNPVARRALLFYHRQNQLNSLKMVLELVLQSKQYSNDIKGRMIEKYILTTLDVNRKFSFRFRKIKISKSGSSCTKKGDRNIAFDSVVHFSGNKLPPVAAFKKNAMTLFVPESPNYPGFDFFIWDSKREILMGFQVTVLQPFTNHSKMNNMEGFLNQWQKFCFGVDKPKPMELYWVIPKSCIGSNAASVQDSIILFEDMVSDFPALSKFSNGE